MIIPVSFFLIAFQHSLLEASYVQRSHLYFIKFLYQGYGNLTTLNNEENKKIPSKTGAL